MADNWLARCIDYSNRQVFEGLLDFFIHPKFTWKTYRRLAMQNYMWWEDVFQKPYEDWMVQELDDDKDQVCLQALLYVYWRTRTLFYLLRGFLTRLVFFPLAAVIYTLSRIGLIVLNPFAWRHNPWKALSMTIVSVVPIFLMCYKHVDLVTDNNMRYLSSSLSMPDGVWGLGSIGTGSMMTSVFIAIGMAFALHAAKKWAQSLNAYEMKDPKNGNEVAWITAYKHRPVVLRNGPDHVVGNPFHTFNAASDNVRFAYYKFKRPIIGGGAPWQVKNILDAFDGVNKAHGTLNLFDRFKSLHTSLRAAVTSKGHNLSIAHRTHYRITAEALQYSVNPTDLCLVKWTKK